MYLYQHMHSYNMLSLIFNSDIIPPTRFDLFGSSSKSKYQFKAQNKNTM
jgi:hypothetical protein